MLPQYGIKASKVRLENLLEKTIDIILNWRILLSQGKQ